MYIYIIYSTRRDFRTLDSNNCFALDTTVVVVMVRQFANSSGCYNNLVLDLIIICTNMTMTGRSTAKVRIVS
jgi:hypothetical protein